VDSNLFRVWFFQLFSLLWYDSGGA
jgi:hypothetical protein